ncbi:hypothetical protein MASR2M15_14690 [Anaerolineales bacterium]
MIDDESWTYDYMQLSLPKLMALFVDTEPQPAGWWVLFWVWQNLVGVSEFAGRWLAILLNMLTLAIVFRLTYRAFGRPVAAYLAMIAVLLNGLLFTYTLQIRAYPLVFLLAALSMLFFFRWVKQGSWLALGLWVCSAAGLLYVHYFTAFLVIAQLASLILFRPNRFQIKQLAAGLVLLLVLYLPWLPYFMTHVQMLRGYTIAFHGTAALSPAPTEITGLEAIYNYLKANGTGWFWLPIVGVLSGLLWRRPLKPYVFILVCAFVPVLVVWIMNVWVNVYVIRYLAYTAIPLAMAVGVGLAAIPWRWIRGAAVLIFFGLCAVNLNMPATLVPYRDLYQQLDQAAEAEDVLYIEIPEQKGFEWAMSIHERQRRLYLRPEVRDEVVFAPEPVPDARRIWLLTDHWFAPEVQARFREIEQTHLLQQVIGDCKPNWCYLFQLLEAPPRQAPIYFGDDLAFLGMDQAWEGNVLRLRLWWRADQPIDFDYSIGLHLRDRKGRLISQLDSPIQNFYGGESALTSLQTGAVYIDERAFTVPEGAAQDYELAVMVYDWRDMTALPVLQEDALLLDIMGPKGE